MNPQDPNQSADIQTPDGNFSQPVQTPPPVQSDAQPFAPASSPQPVIPPVSTPSMPPPSMNPVSQNIPISTSPIVQESNSNLQPPIQPQMTNNPGFSQPIVNPALSSGDIAGAEKASKRAKTWSLVAILFGILAIFAILAIASIGAARRQSREASGLSDLPTTNSSNLIDTDENETDKTGGESTVKSVGGIKPGTYTINKTAKNNGEGGSPKNVNLVLEKVVVTEEKMTYYVAVTNNEKGEYYTLGAVGLYYSYLKDANNNQIDVYEKDYKKDISEELKTGINVKSGATVRGWVSFPNPNEKSSSYSFKTPLFAEITGITF